MNHDVAVNASRGTGTGRTSDESLVLNMHVQKSQAQGMMAFGLDRFRIVFIICHLLAQQRERVTTGIMAKSCPLRLVWKRKHVDCVPCVFFLVPT